MASFDAHIIEAALDLILKYCYTKKSGDWIDHHIKAHSHKVWGIHSSSS